MRLHHAGCALICAILLAGSGLLGKCSLASYSETRSFRDALKGRSMEDAISGPVDRDASSYGGRTSGGENAGDRDNQQQQIMVTVPLNGNLMNDMVQQRQQQQPTPEDQQQRSTSDLERESVGQSTESSALDATTTTPTTMAPISQPKSGRQVQRVAMMSNGLRLSSPMSGVTQKPAAQQRRSQQQRLAPDQTEHINDYSAQQTMSGTKSASNAGNSESGFGDDQANSPRAGTKGGRRLSGASLPDSQQQPAITQQSTMDSGLPIQQQQQTDSQQELGKGYGQAADGQTLAAKQKAVAAMLMSMNNGMKYSQVAAAMQRMKLMPVSNNQDYSGDNSNNKAMPTAPQGSMAQNMLMSLANKAAYLDRKQQMRAQTTKAPATVMPTMMMTMIPENSSPKQANQKQMRSYNGMRQMAPNAMSAQQQNEMQSGRAYNSRKMEKKMSPSMVNALLNKMMMTQAEQEQMGPNYDAGVSQKSAAMAMLMKSSLGAEMLANMMMNSQQQQIQQAVTEVPAQGATAGMSAAKREQYKRMMMATAMMQQQQQSERTMSPVYGIEQQQQMKQDSNQAFGRKQAASAMSKNGRGYAAGAGADGGAPTTTMSPVAMMMMSMLEQDAKQRENEQQPMNNYADRLMPPTTKSKPSNRPSAMLPANGGYGQANNSPKVAYRNQQVEMGPANKPMGSSNMPMSPMEMMIMTMMNNGAAKDRYNDNSNNGNNNGESVPDADVKRRQRRPMPPPAAARANGQYQKIPKGIPQMSVMPKMSSGARPSMNGFRQAFNQPQQMEQQQQQRQTNADDDGSSDTQQASEYPFDSSMARPMNMMQPMQSLDSATNDGAANSDDAERLGARGARGDSPSNDDDDSNSNTNNGQYGTGAAPMGQAEPFAFDYKIEDPQGNEQYRKEESDKNGVVRGSYGYTDVSGIYRHVEYVADEKGFRANIKSNEPGLNGTGANAGADSGSANGGGSGGSSENSAADENGNDGSDRNNGSDSSSIADDSQAATVAAGNTNGRQPSSSSSALANGSNSNTYASPMDRLAPAQQAAAMMAEISSAAAEGDSQQQKSLRLQQQMQQLVMPAQQQQLQQEVNENGEK